MKRTVQAAFVLLSLTPLAACEYHKLQELNYAEPVGEPFQKALWANYRDLAREEERNYDWEQAVTYADRALRAAYGEDVLPEDPMRWELPDSMEKQFEKAREDLLNIVAGDAKAVRPQLVADAQTNFDCWLEHQAENTRPDEIENCRDNFYTAMQELITPEPVVEEPKKTKPVHKAKPKAKPKAKKPVVKSLEPKPAPAPQPVKDEPKPEPKAEPAPAPVKEEPKPEPVKEEPKAEPKPEAKAEPAAVKEEPKAEAKPEPVTAPALETAKPQVSEPVVEPVPAPVTSTAPAETAKPAVTPFSPPKEESKPAAAPAEPAATKPQSSLGKPAKEMETASYIVFFDAGQSALNPTAEKIVDGAAQSLLKHKSYRVIVNARNDLFGNVESGLPGQRAQMVKNRLILQGIPESSIDLLLAGEASPAAGPQSTPVDRRVEIFVSE